MENYTGKKLEICREILDTLSDYIDAELGDDACRQVEKYIGDCPGRKAFVVSLRRTVELCHQFGISDQPEPLSEGAREDLLSAYKRSLKQCEPLKSEKAGES